MELGTYAIRHKSAKQFVRITIGLLMMEHFISEKKNIFVCARVQPLSIYYTGKWMLGFVSSRFSAVNISDCVPLLSRKNMRLPTQRKTRSEEKTMFALIFSVRIFRVLFLLLLLNLMMRRSHRLSFFRIMVWHIVCDDEKWLIDCSVFVLHHHRRRQSTQILCGVLTM